MLITITGASASGKSEYAEQQIEKLALDAPRIYIATMQPFGEEGKKRVEKHRKQRADRNFETLEVYQDLHLTKLPTHAVVLLECMSNLLANEMFSSGEAITEEFCKKIEDKIMTGVSHILEQCEHLVIVTNEVFSDTLNYPEETVRYIETLGHINQRLAHISDEVVEVVYGIPVWHKNSR